MNKISLTLFIAIAIFLVSCFNAKNEETTITVTTNTQSIEGSCPHLTKDPNGNIVLSWIKKLDSTQSVFCYTISMDNGHSFEKTITIPGSENIHANGENMPKVIFKPSGKSSPHGRLVIRMQRINTPISSSTHNLLMKDKHGQSGKN